MAAAKAMLDEIHPALPNCLHDHDTYTLGQMGVHNIVVTYIPSGVYGTTSAVTVETSMLLSFRSIHVGLMVGIGGGAPSPHNNVLPTPLTAESLTSLRRTIEQKSCSLDETGKQRLQKLANAAEKAFADRALLFDENRLLFE